jgi:glyoxylase-like metal-dependent hydrolase (beta-lactamase superfamily II)
VHVLVTIYWHTRSTREIVERYGARVWAHTRARGAVARRAGAVSDAFRIGDALPGGIEAIAVPRGSEVVYWLPEQRALVTGDVILGERGGDLRLCPESWLQTGGHAELKTNLRPLLELPVERVLVCHGEPVLSDAHAKLERLLAA